MDAIKNILLDDKSNNKVKFGAIMMMAQSNQHKAEEIVNLLKKYKCISSDLVDDILNKLDEINEYKKYISEDSTHLEKENPSEIPSKRFKTNMENNIDVPQNANQSVQKTYESTRNENKIQKQEVSCKKDDSLNFSDSFNIPTFLPKSKFTLDNLPVPIELLFYKNHQFSVNNINSFQSTAPIELNLYKKNSEKKIKINEYDTELDFLMFPLQCNVCGLRFPENIDGRNLFGNHLDDHTRKERIFESTTSISRDYFSSYEQFISNVRKIDLEIQAKEENTIYKAEKVYCDICKEKIEKDWNDEIEDWVLVDCLMMDAVERKFCHKKCIL